MNLFTTYFISEIKERQEELDFCMERNLNNPHIGELNVFADDPATHSLQTNPIFHQHLGKIKFIRYDGAPTYRSWLENSPAGISILFNADIYFDESIRKVPEYLKKPNSIVCLSRHEDEMDSIIPHKNPQWSQDLWAVNLDHENNLQFMGELEVRTGRYRCDNKIAYVFSVNGWDIYNPHDEIKCYHRHNSKVRNYDKLDTSIVGALGFVSARCTPDSPSEIEINIMPVMTDHIKKVSLSSWLEEQIFPEKKRPRNEILDAFLEDRTRRDSDVAEVQMLDWQHPSLTEKQALLNHSFHHDEPDPGNAYLGFPWATLLDLHTHRNLDLGTFLKPLKEKTKAFEGRRIHTVCQHIRWPKLTALWAEIGLTDVHLSHCEKDTPDTERLSFHPWPLIATNYENPRRSEGLAVKEHKKSLASFVGNHTNGYRSDRRLRLHEMLKGREDVVCEVGDEWFYNPDVYDRQIQRKGDDGSAERKRLATTRYNEILSESVFSLCPEGSGPNTIRLWESIAVGSIPVIFADNWKAPQIGTDWDRFSVWIPASAYTHTIQILEAIDEETRRSMRNECLSVYKKFSSMRCF